MPQSPPQCRQDHGKAQARRLRPAPYYWLMAFTLHHATALAGEVKISFTPLTPEAVMQAAPGSLLPACYNREARPHAIKHQQEPPLHRDQLSVDRAGPYAAYFGTLHSHSESSDAEGAVEDAYRYARDVAHLDFFAITDHPEYWLLREKHHYETQKSIAALSARPGFIPLVGFEYSSAVFGHYVVLAANAVRNAFEDLTLEGFYEWLKRPEQAGVIVMFAHPGFHEYRIATEFNHFAFDPALADKMVGIEVLHWSEYERYLHGYSGKVPFIDEAISSGWRVGAAASEDVHAANWGTRDSVRMALLLPRLSESEIYAALRARRFYATNNKDLQFAVNARTQTGKIVSMGDTLRATDLQPGETTLAVTARYYDHDCEGWPDRFEVVIDGQVVARYEFPPPQVPYGMANAGEFSLQLPLPPRRQAAHFYVRFYQGSETFTESSPIFLDP